MPSESVPSAGAAERLDPLGVALGVELDHERVLAARVVGDVAIGTFGAARDLGVADRRITAVGVLYHLGEAIRAASAQRLDPLKVEIGVELGYDRIAGAVMLDRRQTAVLRRELAHDHVSAVLGNRHVVELVFVGSSERGGLEQLAIGGQKGYRTVVASFALAGEIAIRRFARTHRDDPPVARLGDGVEIVDFGAADERLPHGTARRIGLSNEGVATALGALDSLDLVPVEASDGDRASLDEGCRIVDAVAIRQRQR